MIIIEIWFISFTGYIQAEVQSLFADGALSLHTRSLKYGKVWSIWLHSIGLETELNFTH